MHLHLHTWTFVLYNYLECYIIRLCVLLLTNVEVNVDFLVIHKTDKWFSLTLCTSLAEICADGHSVFLFHFKKHSWTVWEFTFEREDFISAAVFLWGPYATFKLKGIMLSWLWKREVLVHLIQHEGLQHCLTARPSGIQSTELSIVWYAGSSWLRMKTQTPFHFTNTFFFLLLLPADPFLLFSLEGPLIRHRMDN